LVLENYNKTIYVLNKRNQEKLFFKIFSFLFADLSYSYKLTHVIIKFYRRNFLMEQNKLNSQTVDDNENPFAINDLNVFGIDSLFAAQKKSKDEDDDYDDDDDAEEKDDYYDDDEEDEDDLFEEEPKNEDDLEDEFDIDELEKEDLFEDDDEETPFI
jgi:hypothetical protein